MSECEAFLVDGRVTGGGELLDPGEGGDHNNCWEWGDGSLPGQIDDNGSS